MNDDDDLNLDFFWSIFIINKHDCIYVAPF